MAFTKVLPAGISSATNLVIDSINSAGVVTATGIVASTGTFSGNVSIAGTLTYEDVSNIDSVGIITAQSGIHVTGGNIGVNNTNPQSQLHVTNASASTISLMEDGASGADLVYNGSTNYFSIKTGTGGPGSQTTRLTIQRDNGNIGIGTDNPGASLQITANSPGILFQDANSGSTESKVEGLSGHLYYTTDNVNRDHIFSATGGSESLRITGDGNIGIGTDNPIMRLHVHGAANSADSRIRLSSIEGSGLTIRAQSATENNINADSGEDITFSRGNVESLRIDSSGNIGIGSDNPSRRLHVQSPGSTPSALFGNSANNNSIEVTRTGSTGSYFQVQTYTNICNIVGGPTLTFRTSDPVGSASTERLRITPSGDVGLKLTDNSTVKYGLTLAQGSTDPYKLGWADGGGTKRGAIWVNSTNDAMEFMTGTSDTQRMRIRSDGRFELTTNGTYLSATTVDYYVNAGTSRTYGLYVHKNGTGTYGNYTYTLGGTSTQYAVGGQVDTNSAYSSGGGLFYSINSNTYGIVGYWSTAAYYTLYGNGVSLCTGGHTTSDARLKDVQSGIGTGILDKVCSLEAKKYTWKENTQQRRSVGDGTQIGLLAQDVLEHFPEVVMEHENPEIAGHNPETLNEQIGTTYSVDYGKLTAVLIEAIKDLKAENNALAARVDALEG